MYSEGQGDPEIVKGLVIPNIKRVYIEGSLIALQDIKEAGLALCLGTEDWCDKIQDLGGGTFLHTADFLCRILTQNSVLWVTTESNGFGIIIKEAEIRWWKCQATTGLYKVFVLVRIYILSFK